MCVCVCVRERERGWNVKRLTQRGPQAGARPSLIASLALMRAFAAAGRTPMVQSVDTIRCLALGLEGC